MNSVGFFFGSKQMKHTTFKQCLENTFDKRTKRSTVCYYISRSFLEGLYMTTLKKSWSKTSHWLASKPTRTRK